MSARVIIGPWPGSNIINLNYPPQVRIEMARLVEQRQFESEEAERGRFRKAVSIMHGSYGKPGDME
jgi:hypothetical protein